MARTAWQERIGVGRPHYGIGPRTGSTRITPVVSDDGPLRGQTVGKTREHADGRIDAKATRATVHVNPSLTARKDPA